MRIGIVALQGNFDAHREKLAELDVKSIFITKREQLGAVSALVLPGGESTAMLRLMDSGFRQTLAELLQSGLPCLATCAGTILIAKSVANPPQESLGVIDIDVTRNAYGRQADSFISSDLHWTSAAADLLNGLPDSGQSSLDSIEGVFIRAPKISRTGHGVETLLELNREPVLVREEGIFAATFHPELSQKQFPVIHQLFVSSI